MAAGRIVLSQYFPARDRNARLVSGALLYVYTNGTTTKASIYAEEALTTPLANPVAANSSGQFPAIWASDAVTYTLSITAADGSSIGNPSVFDDYSVSTDADTASVALAEAAAASAAADLADMLAVVATGDDAAAIAARAAKAANLSDLADGEEAFGNLDFLQSGTGALVRTAKDKAREVVSVKDFGATGDGTTRLLSARFASIALAQVEYPFVTSLDQTQDWAGIMAALAASQAIHIPAGTYRCGGTEITITRPTRVTGDGPQISVLTFNASVNGLNFDMVDSAAANAYFNSLDGIGIVNTMTEGTPTAGAGLAANLAYYSEFTNFRIENFYDGINIVQCPVSAFRGFVIETFDRYGFASTGGNNFDCRVEDFVISGQTGAGPSVHGDVGIYLNAMNDEFVFQNGIINYCTNGLYTTATNFQINDCPEFCRFINVSFDSNEQGMDLASCADMVFVACFISNRPNNGAVIGQRAATRNVQYIGCTFQSNGGTGVVLWPDAEFTSFIGCKFQGNSTVTPSAGHGVVVQADTTDFSFIDCQFDNGWGSGTQNFGLYITATSCNRFAVIGCNFAASGGTFNNASTGADQNIYGNVGFDTLVVDAATSFNVAGTKVVGAQGAAVADLTVTATAGTLPTPGGSVTIADAATPTVVELLDFCVELESKLETALARLRAHGLIAT